MLFYGMQPCSESSTKDAIEVTHEWTQGLFSGTITLPAELDDTITVKSMIIIYNNILRTIPFSTKLKFIRAEVIHGNY